MFPYPVWSEDPDYIVLRSELQVENPRVGNIDGEWIDRSRMPYLELVVRGLFGVVVEPTDRFEIAMDGTVAQVWRLREP